MFSHAISTVEQAPRVDRRPVISMLRHPKLIACHSGAALERWGRCGCASEWVYSLYSRWVAVQTRVQKWGNSLGVRIPRGLAEAGLIQSM
jgi:hypothetical protein